jgi:hypothetical protein
MELLVVTLLASLSTVIGVLIFFMMLYRRERRRRSALGVTTASPELFLRGPRRPFPFPLPARWMAVNGATPERIRAAFRGKVAVYSGWADALSRCRERTVFVSPSVDGWSLVVGGDLPDVFQDVDRAFHRLRELGDALGTIQFFSADRVLHSHAWVRIDQGHVTRAYAWAGSTLWNEGRVSLEERLLGLRCREYGEEPESEPVPIGEVSPESHNTDRVVLLARKWSVDPLIASELILLHESALERGGRAVDSEDGLSGT